MEANESTFLKLWKSYRNTRNIDQKIKQSQETRTNRRSTRNSIALRKRNIGVLTPINSPAPRANIDEEVQPSSSKTATKKDEKVKKSHTKSDPRLEMLKKWQEEKNKKQQQEKTKIKPIFKVQHVTTNATFNLDKVYTEIKGKPIGAFLKPDKKNILRPVKSHKFRAPANIEPVGNQMENSVMNLRSRQIKKTRNQTSKANIKIKETSKQPVQCTPKQRKLNNPLNSTPSTSKTLDDLHDQPVEKSATRRSLRTATPKVTEENDVTENKENVTKKKSRKSLLKAVNGSSLDLPNKTITTDNSNRSHTPCKIAVLNRSGEHCYISPFVTTSRGSENARREYRERLLGSPMTEDLNNSRSPKAAGRYFKMLLNDESQRLLLLCEKWNDYKMENTAEEVGDMINVAVGQTDLLLKKKFTQFQGLIQCCETGQSEKPVTCLDLHGFWDTMKLQVTNLDKRFEYLDKLKDNNWEEIAPVQKAVNKGKPKKVQSKKAKPSSSLKAMIEARRRKLVEESTNLVQTLDDKKQDSKTPLKRRTSRASQIASDSNRRLSSPGLTIMKVTQLAKSTEQNKYPTTPGDKMIAVQQPKSILKSEPRRSIRKSKAVLFKDSPEFHLENNINIPNTVSPSVDTSKRRRSRRLSKLNFN